MCIFVRGRVVVTVGTNAGATIFGVVAGESVVVETQPPNQPYFTHDVVKVGGAILGVAVEDIVVVSKHPPNHPYFTQDVVGTSSVDVEELVELMVVVSSRQPADISC